MSDILLNINLPVHPADIVSGLIFIAGGVLLVLWFATAGPASLAKNRIRHNRIPYYMPFLLVFVWIIGISLVSMQLKRFFPGENADGSEITTYVAIVLVEVAIIAFIFCLARKNFARGLRGFGLNIRTLLRDICSAAINYITVFPLVMIGLLAVVWVGQMVKGEDFLMQKNEGLEILLKSSPSQQCFLILAFVVIVPIFEEMLFRGLLQSVLRQFVSNAWIAIIAASVIFTLLHPPMHWPALFFLSCCMGYAYEKSGSLIRPILVHAIFNAVNIAGVLLSGIFPNS